MTMLMISYDLNKSGQNYQELYEAIKSLGDWWHHLDSTWLLKTDLSARQVCDRIQMHIDSNDNLLIMRVDPQTACGWLPKKAGAWIQDLYL